MPEALVGIATNPDDGIPQYAHVRDLTLSETKASAAAAALLRRFTDEAPVAEMARSFVVFSEAIDKFAQHAWKHDPRDADDLQRAFRAWLHAFREVDYGTTYWIRTRPEKKHLLERFATITSEEYEANVAYRLCCQLRNYSKLTATVINGLQVARQLQDDGSVSQTVRLHLHADKLVASFPTMNAAVRKELVQVDQPLDVDLIVGYATQACERIHCRFALEMLPDLRAAIDRARRYHAEAVSVSGRGAAVAFMTNYIPFAAGKSQSTVRSAGWEHAQALERDLPAMRRTAHAAPLEVTWRDVIATE